MKSWAYKWQVLVSVVFGTFMVMMDATVVNVALPKLQEVFAGGNVAQVQWVISAYTMALGIVTPISGFIADRYGIKRLYLLSLAAFTVGSALCAIAPSLPLLILFRVIQGVGGGSVIPLGTAMLFSAFPREERGMAYGFFGMALVVAPALGPLLSGFFIEYLDWKLIFLINIPIGLTGIFIGWRLLKQSIPEAKQRLDSWGILTSVLAFGFLLYAFSSAEQDGWTSPTILISMAVGVISLLAFIAIELAQRETLVDLRLFRKYHFLIGNFLGWVSVIALFGAEFLLPLYLQIIRGRSALETGFMLLPLAIASGIAVPLAGKISDKIGARPLVVVGYLILIFNTWQFSQLSFDTSIPYLLLLITIRGLSLGMIVQIPQQVALLDIEPLALPRASSLVSSSRLVFQSLGVAVLGTIVSSAAGQQPAFTGGTPPGPAVIAAFHADFLQGLQNAYIATMLVGIVALIISFFLPGWPGKVLRPRPEAELPEEAENTNKREPQPLERES
ncbi:MAG TPA: DHA2 family efflux MFS transporter permease subunit [Chloroflexia bacterium]|nr:DHA2 family efflux MFS transporter permease subunit [Chloroflexia bacterium]